MGAAYICTLAGVLILGILIGIAFGITRFGKSPPVGTLKIRYEEGEEKPVIFLELWHEVEEVAPLKSVNLLIDLARK